MLDDTLGQRITALVQRTEAEADLSKTPSPHIEGDLLPDLEHGRLSVPPVANGHHDQRDPGRRDRSRPLIMMAMRHRQRG